MFVHFGLYSTLGGEWHGRETGSHEWIRNNARIPHEEYSPLLRSFDPRKFDADALARLASNAGQKYLVFTTKHHEGFSLFDSSVTTYDVMATPLRRDLMREVSDACRRYGLRIGWYYSIMDWYHPDYLPRREWEQRSVRGADFKRYVTFMRAQLRELLTNYGEIAILWFDGGWESTWTHDLGASLLEYCRSLAPGVIVNNRIGGVRPGETPVGPPLGDFITPEQEVPTTGLPGTKWESCLTMNHNWGYSKFDHDWKSVPTLIGLLIETASKGGNLLLNVGPKGDGTVPAECVERLGAIGDWMGINGSAIYGTTATPFTAAPHPVTVKETRLNVFIHNWEASRQFELPGVRDRPRRAFLLSDRANGQLQTSNTSGGLAVTLTDRPPDSIWPVVTLEFDTPPRIDTAR